MAASYILINVSAGHAYDVLTELGQLGAKAHLVTGHYDIIAFVEKDYTDALLKFVFDEIQKIDGVTRTTTCIIVPVD